MSEELEWGWLRRRAGIAIAIAVLVVVAFVEAVLVFLVRTPEPGPSEFLPKKWLMFHALVWLLFPIVLVASGALMVAATDLNWSGAARLTLLVFLIGLFLAAIELSKSCSRSGVRVFLLVILWGGPPAVWFGILVRAIRRVRDLQAFRDEQADPRTQEEHLWRSGAMTDEEYDRRLRELGEP